MISPMFRRVCLSIKPSSLYGGASCSSVTRALVLVVLAVLGLGASTGMAAPSSSGIPAPAKAAPEQLKSGAAERPTQRGAPGQREARLRSRSVLRGASRAQMLQAGRSNFADVFSRRLFDGRHPDPQMTITEYRGDSGALVRDSEGRKMLLNSTMPLRARAANGAMEPVDLSLRESTQTFTTANSNADVQIFKDPARGVRFVDEGFSISPGGAASPGASVGMQSDGRVVFDDAEGSDSDVSFVVVPQPTGVEVGWLVGTDVAPETYTLKIDLPAGAHVRRTRTDHPIPGDPPRTFEIVDRDGKSLAYITPPMTVDSDGVTVESSMRIGGRDRLVVTVEHRGEDLHFPLFVDPQIMVHGRGGSGGWPGWATYQKPEVPTRIASDYNINYYGWALADPAYYPYGPYMSMPTRTLFDMETHRALQYRAAPDTYVIAATFGNMSHDEILSTGTYNNWWQGILNPARDTWQHLWAGNRSAFGITHSFGCCQTISPAASIQNYAIIGLGATAPSYNQYLWSGENSAAIALDWANVYIDDFHPPRLDTRPSDQGWSNTPSRTLSVSGSDLGTGLLAFKLTGPGIDKTVHSTATPCHVQGGDWLPPVCPAGGQTVTKNITYTPAEGSHTYSLTAIDAAGNTSSPHTWTEKLDTTKPSIDLPFAGDTATTDNPAVYVAVTEENFSIEVAAEDGLSGVKRARLLNAARAEIDTENVNCASGCPTAPPDVTLTGPVSALNEQQEYTVEVTDAADNATEVPVMLVADRTAPPAPSDIKVQTFSGSGTATIGWEPQEDPDLSNGDPGSGVDHFEYSYKRALGNWTPWASTESAQFDVPNGLLLEPIAVKVLQVDAAGNEGPQAGQSVSLVLAQEQEPALPSGGTNTIQVTRDITLNGEILPGAGTEVELRSAADHLYVLRADEDGEATFTNVPNGAYTVTTGYDDVQQFETTTVSGSQTRNYDYTVTYERLSKTSAPLSQAAFCLGGYQHEFVKRKVACARFLEDRSKALYFTNRLFYSTGGPSRANAFQHSFWVAQMVRSIAFMRRGINVLGFTENDYDMALSLANAHETDNERGGGFEEQQNSKMDDHNNRYGYNWAVANSPDSRGVYHNDQFFCTTLRSGVKTSQYRQVRRTLNFHRPASIKRPVHLSRKTESGYRIRPRDEFPAGRDPCVKP